MPKESPSDNHDFSIDSGVVERLLCHEGFLVSCHPAQGKKLLAASVGSVFADKLEARTVTARSSTA
jgi:hypothetical protein